MYSRAMTFFFARYHIYIYSYPTHLRAHKSVQGVRMSMRWLVSSWQLHDALRWHLMTVWNESCKCHELTRHLNFTNPMRHVNVTNSKRHLITWHPMSLWVREFHSSEFVTFTWRIELTSHWWNPLKWVRDITWRIEVASHSWNPLKWVRDIYMTHWVDISLPSHLMTLWVGEI